MASVLPYALSLGLSDKDIATITNYDQLDQSQPHPVLVLGTEPMQELRTRKLVPGNRGIMSLRTELLSLPNFPGCLMLSYSPGVCDTDTKMHTDLLVDFMMMARFAATGSPKPKLGDYQWVNDFSEEIGRIKMAFAKTGKPIKIGMDTETTGKVPYGVGKHFVCIQVAIEPGRTRMVYFKDRAAQDAWLAQYRWQLEWLLNAPEVWTIFANGKYDLNWFWVMAALKCTNFKFDTTGVGSLLDENRSNSLNIHTKLMAPELGGYDDELEAKYDKAFMEKVPQVDLLPYAGGDPDATLRVAAVEREQLLKDPALTQFYLNILHPAQRAYETIEQGGVLVDMEAYGELSHKLHTRLNDIIKGVREVIGPTLWDKHKDDTKVGGINLTKASLINDFLFSPGGCNLKPEMKTAKSGEPSTAKEHVLMFANCGNKDAEAFVKVFSDFSGTSKMLSTYVTGFLKHIRSDGRFHPSYYLFAGDKDDNEGGTVCMPASELVLTNRGYLSVKDVRVGDSVIGHSGKPRQVLETVVNGVKPLVRVTLANGLSLRTTENHEYLTVPGSWIAAKDLTPGTWAVTHSDAEAWAKVKEWLDFEVSSWGRVRNLKTGHVLTQFKKGAWGHLKVCLHRNGSQVRGPDRRDFTVHRLMALAFNLPGEGPEIRHLNGIAWDNTIGNLRHGSIAENKQDAVVHHAMDKRKGDEAKLTAVAVAFIRSQPRATRGGGWTNKKLADKYGVCERLIRAVRSGDRWGLRPPSQFGVQFSHSQIVSVEYEPAEMTYGVMVDIDHSHVTGGIVTHNTGRLSCKDPAFQCLKGDTPVLTNTGWHSIESIVDSTERGQLHEVLTHTGAWRPIVGTYRNGVRPVYLVTFENGVTVTSTGNHPYLTIRGWVRTDELLPGDTGYALQQDTWAPFAQLHEPDLSLMGFHEGQMPVQDQPGVSAVRRERNSDRPAMGRLLPVFGGHGREAGEGLEHRAQRCERKLHENQLRVGFAGTAGPQPQEQQEHHMAGAHPDRSGMGSGVRHKSGAVALPLGGWNPDGAGLEEGAPADRRTFKEVRIVSIEPAGECETFDLTIHSSHSFVAGGVVVHNTIPQHTEWTNDIRRCFPAPPGMRIVGKDYSQGELRILACVAMEPTMLEAYRNDIDMHALTGGHVNGFTYEQMMEMKLKDPKLFKKIRQGGKAGNFGLIYLVSHAGYQAYAHAKYQVEMTIQKAEEDHSAFFQKYPGVTSYHQTYIKYAHQHGFVPSPLGRIRHLPLINSQVSVIRHGAERQAVNSPIQSTLNDIMLWALGIAHERGWDKEAPCFGTVHDAGYNYVPEDNWEFYVKRDKEMMENLPFEKVGWKPALPFPVDVKVGPNLADLEEIKL